MMSLKWWEMVEVTRCDDDIKKFFLFSIRIVNKVISSIEEKNVGLSIKILYQITWHKVTNLKMIKIEYDTKNALLWILSCVKSNT